MECGVRLASTCSDEYSAAFEGECLKGHWGSLGCAIRGGLRPFGRRVFHANGPRVYSGVLSVKSECEEQIFFEDAIDRLVELRLLIKFHFWRTDLPGFVRFGLKKPRAFFSPNRDCTFKLPLSGVDFAGGGRSRTPTDAHFRRDVVSSSALS